MKRIAQNGMYVVMVNDEGESFVANITEQRPITDFNHLPPGGYIIARHGKKLTIWQMDTENMKDEADEEDDSEQYNN